MRVCQFRHFGTVKAMGETRHGPIRSRHSSGYKWIVTQRSALSNRALKRALPAASKAWLSSPPLRKEEVDYILVCRLAWKLLISERGHDAKVAASGADALFSI
jgi:hypothetical protein